MSKGGGRRWLGLGVAAVSGAAVASVGAGLVTAGLREPATPVAAPPAVTVTVDPPAPAEPAPLPTAEADRHTCMEGWLTARGLVNKAVVIGNELPKGDDAAVRDDPEWRYAVERIGKLFRQAGDSLEPQIALGTTPALAEAARAAAAALRTEGYAFETFNPGMGNASAMEDETSGLMAALCTRLVPE